MRWGAECDTPLSLADQRHMRELGGLHPYKLQLAGSLIYQAKQNGADVDWKRVEQDFTQQVNATFRHEPNAPAPKPSALKTILMGIVTLPRTLGRAALDLIGKHDSYESSQWLVGFLVIALVLAVLFGFLKMDALQSWLGTLTGAGSK